MWGEGQRTAREETVFREDSYGVYEEYGDCRGRSLASRVRRLGEAL